MKNTYKNITLQGYALPPTAPWHNPAPSRMTHFSEHSPDYCKTIANRKKQEVYRKIKETDQKIKETIQKLQETD
jgi:hypothetical protein